jgi:hypothetical protein
MAVNPEMIFSLCGLVAMAGLVLLSLSVRLAMRRAVLIDR